MPWPSTTARATRVPARPRPIGDPTGPSVVRGESLHDFALVVYSHADHDGDPPRPPDEAAPCERPDAPVSASLETAVEADRRPGAPPPIRVAVVGATGYVGAELIRLLDRHPAVQI